MVAERLVLGLATWLGLLLVVCGLALPWALHFRLRTSGGPIRPAMVAFPSSASASTWHLSESPVTTDQFQRVLGHPAPTDPSVPAKVSFADARAYCEALSRIEGARYRLPTRAELAWGGHGRVWTSDERVPGERFFFIVRAR